VFVAALIGSDALYFDVLDDQLESNFDGLHVIH